MNLLLLFVLIGYAVIVLAPLLTPQRVLDTLPVVLRILLGLVVLGFAGFFGVGFLSTLEPLEPSLQWGFRIFYLLAGLGTLAGAVRTLPFGKPTASL